MKRIIVFALSLILAALVLCGCGKQTNSGALEGQGKRFEVIYKDVISYVVVDTETGVEYAVSRGSYNAGTFTMLYDSYGNPYIYPGFDAREDRP